MRSRQFLFAGFKRRESDNKYLNRNSATFWKKNERSLTTNKRPWSLKLVANWRNRILINNTFLAISYQNAFYKFWKIATPPHSGVLYFSFLTPFPQNICFLVQFNGIHIDTSQSGHSNEAPCQNKRKLPISFQVIGFQQRTDGQQMNNDDNNNNNNNNNKSHSKALYK